MDNTTYISLSRQMALWNQLEVVSNNLANMKTVGFKGNDTLFADYVYKLDQDERTFKDRIAFVHDFGLVRNLSQGVLDFTGNTFDLALKGDGYFVTRGRGGVETYTRAGNFALSPAGNLVTMEGRLVLGRNGAPINIPPDAREVDIQGDGTITDRDGRTFGQLRVVRFEDERELKQVDGTGFISETQPPIDLERPQVGQGVLEASNVNPVIEMTRLISLNRAYQENSRMIQQEDERKRRANEVFTRTVTA
ncbi:MAG: flagellar basal-body rod protein FlgF [Alphaproteobacteria bacterium]|nr:flagellar basal-body rod protein FlgF [Alphaproteobacteria bacterium]